MRLVWSPIQIKIFIVTLGTSLHFLDYCSKLGERNVI